MVFYSDEQIKRIVEICKRYDELEIAACCADKVFVVDAKVLGAMRILRGGGEVYFYAEGNQEQYDKFLHDLVEASKNEG